MNPRRASWSLRRWAAITAVLAITLAVGSIVGGGIALYQLRTNRATVVDQLDPAIRAALNLTNALVNEETGIRGYALSAQADFLQPYQDGVAAETGALKDLTDAVGDRYPTITSDLARVRAAVDAWRSGYVVPTLAAIGRSGAASSSPDIDRGKALFDQVRATLAPIQSDLNQLQQHARAALDRSAGYLTATAVTIGVVLLIGSVALTVAAIKGVTRPITALAGQVRLVAAGGFGSRVAATGPAEILGLGADVDSMRRRILAELEALRQAHEDLEAQAAELTRSNAELEQFAYVASHDLQEPLRKVASFCELIEARYGDQLDERGKQYIDFAVDGATRMQALINDLLAFSRVGRMGYEPTTVQLDDSLRTALRNLATPVAETGALVIADPLPTVTGDAALLTSVIQNLISNAIKFRQPDIPPQIGLTVQERPDGWLFTCADNGIGIDPQYADRIFVIFQRLHSKAAYPGTGIGLAMCRKIIEFHGGRIWLDVPSTGTGTRFHFTLPRQSQDGAKP